MRIAYLILAHANPDQLYTLVSTLCNTHTDIFIHIDLKTNIQPFLRINAFPNVTFIQQREKVYWGAYSIVQATLNGLDVIAHSGQEYGYVHLLSGQDYPIASQAGIYNWFSANPGKAFMEYYPVQETWQEAIPRITKYHLTNFNFKGRHTTEKIMNLVLPQRKLPYSMEAVGRSQWFSITGEQVHYIINFLATHPRYTRFFKLSWGADELFFQTILFNSPFKTAMVNNNLRYIDWSAGGVSPKTLTPQDKDLIFSSQKFFARKFSGAAGEPVIALIDEHIAMSDTHQSTINKSA